MRSASKPRWQQVTALVSLSAGGAITGFSFVPGAAPDLTSPAGLPIHLLALEQSAQPTAGSDAMLRSAIVNVANYYLQMARQRTPAEMEAIIWQNDSIDGADHGQSCAAFASLTLELAAQVVGQRSWVTGGTSYPWPIHKWADARVDPNPASLGVVSILQDAEAHHRWHPLGDGYQPLPGDWVLFNGHVEVVSSYAGGVLHTVGGDSLPNFSVNAHEYPAPLGGQGVTGFVNNGALPGAAKSVPRSREHVPGGRRARDHADPGLAAIPGAPETVSARRAAARLSGGAAIPAAPATAAVPGKDSQSARRQPRQRQGGPAQGSRRPDQAAPGKAVNAGGLNAGFSGPAAARRAAGPRAATPRAAPSQAGTPQAGTPQAGTPQAGTPQAGAPQAAAPRAARRREAKPRAATPGAAAIPGAPMTANGRSDGSQAPSAGPYGRHQPSPAAASVRDTNAQQAFIGEVAPGAVAAQRTYGVPASVTIAQAIDESGWGASSLATKDNNLFGIKGTGPAGRDLQLTQEYENGKPVTRTASFRVYHNIAESINDHGKLLATSGYYSQAMADRQNPNAFAAALTGVYATDPNYGAKLIGLMRRYDLYRYDAAAPASAAGIQSSAYQPLPEATPSTQTVAASRLPTPIDRQPRRIAARDGRKIASRYQEHIPQPVRNAFIATARVPLMRAEPLYRDVASHSGIRWELLAACDWMQCEARPRYSPVHGEKLGTVNPSGTIYRTKSAALEQCADDLVELSRAVYRIDLTARGDLSVRDLAKVFAAFRWGGLLKLHHTSAMEFPYSVAGLTAEHTNMRWPNIDEPNAPDKPGGRFRRPFGAVPIVLSLHYPATV